MCVIITMLISSTPKHLADDYNFCTGKDGQFLRGPFFSKNGFKPFHKREVVRTDKAVGAVQPLPNSHG